MKSAVFYFNQVDYTLIRRRNKKPFLVDLIRPEVVEDEPAHALVNAKPRPGEIVLNSVLLEE